MYKGIFAFFDALLVIKSFISVLFINAFVSHFFPNAIILSSTELMFALVLVISF